MILGFNHNVTYKGEVFHVQTEDSGVKQPNITTLLYKGGVILCSQKTSYADILRMENLEVVVEELMKEQHKDMMRRLKTGEFDDRAFYVPASTFKNHEITGPMGGDDEQPVQEYPVKEPTEFSRADLSLALKKAASQIAEQSPSLSAPLEKAAGKSETLDDALAAFFASKK